MKRRPLGVGVINYAYYLPSTARVIPNRPRWA